MDIVVMCNTIMIVTSIIIIGSIIRNAYIFIERLDEDLYIETV